MLRITTTTLGATLACALSLCTAAPVAGASNKGGATAVEVNSSWDGTLDFSDPFEGPCSDPVKGCQHYTGTATFKSGTFQGSTATIEGNGQPQPDGSYHFTETWTVTGTVAGCSTGTVGSFKFTETGDERLDPNPLNLPGATNGTAQWAVLRGSGTGGLAGLRSGGGTDTFRTDADLSTIHGTTTGTLICARSRSPGTTSPDAKSPRKRCRGRRGRPGRRGARGGGGGCRRAGG